MTDLFHCLVRTRGSAYILEPDEFETVRQKRKYESNQLYETTDLFGFEVAFLPGEVVAMSRGGRPQMEEMAAFFSDAEDIFGDDNPYDEDWKP